MRSLQAARVRLRSLLCTATLSVSLSVAAAPPDPARTLADIPGFDFSKLSPRAASEFATVLTDEFDYCGKPLTLLATLKNGDACPHTRRMVSLAAQLASSGLGSQEILVALGNHTQSFGRARAKFRIDERSCIGAANAQVTLVEFSDFECPFCAQARPLFESLVKQRQDVRLCWIAFPLPQHPNANVAGQAALFARDNGKFWEMHDALFINQSALSPSVIRTLVGKAGLDVKAYDKAVAARRYLDDLTAQRAQGEAAGVDQTPTIYLNGRKHALDYTKGELAVSIDDEKDWSTSRNAFSGQ